MSWSGDLARPAPIGPSNTKEDAYEDAHSALSGYLRTRDAATRFRRALNEQHGRLTNFQGFPSGCCGDASELLGQYFQHSGLGEWQYVFGWQGTKSHAWIEQNGLIVDITADQLRASVRPVLVTHDRTWHAQFRPAAAKHLASLNSYVGADHQGTITSALSRE